MAIDIDFDLRNETKNILRVFGASIVLKLDDKKPIKLLYVVIDFIWIRCLNMSIFGISVRTAILDLYRLDVVESFYRLNLG